MMQKGLSISGSKDWSSQRKTVRRVRPDRRTSMRLTPDRRRGFGRRDEDRAEAALLEKKLSAALTKAGALGPKDLRLARALHELGIFYYNLGHPIVSQAYAAKLYEIFNFPS